MVTVVVEEGVSGAAEGVVVVEVINSDGEGFEPSTNFQRS